MVQACLGQYYNNGAYRAGAYNRPSTYTYQRAVPSPQFNQAVPSAPFAFFGNNPDLNELNNIGVDSLRQLTAQLKTFLPASGNVVTNVDGVPTINTKFGAFPLQRNTYIPDDVRAQFLPVFKALVTVFENEELDPQAANTLLSISRDLTNKLPERR